MTYIGFVGSSESHWSTTKKMYAIQKISEILNQCIAQYGKDNITFVSGGCKKGGIDIWAEIVADSLSLKTLIFTPEVEQWDDYNQEMAGGEGWGRPEIHRKGYMSRNIEIAKICDILYCIDPKGRVGGGGFWTLGYSKGLGKEVHHITIR